MPASIETKFDEKKANEVIRLIQHHSLVPNSDGLVVLPPHYQSISFNGNVYVSKGEHGELIVFVPSRIGRKQLLLSPINDDYWVQGYLFTDIPCNSPGGTCSWIMNGPTYSAPWNVRNNLKVQELSLLGGMTKVAKHWYAVDIMS